MKENNQFNEWDHELKSLLGSPPEPNFKAWQKRYHHIMDDRSMPTVEATICEEPQTIFRSPPQRKRHRVLLKTGLQIAATILLICSATWLLVSSSHERPLIAGEIQGVDNVSLLSWTELIYIRVTSEDKQRTWIETQKAEIQYQHPGRFRKTFFNPTGSVNFVQVIDSTVDRELTLNPTERSAELKYLTRKEDERGPFAWVGDYIRGTYPGSVSLAGRNVFDGIESDVIKWKSTSSGEKASFYLSTDTRQLVGLVSVNPGVDFDPLIFDESSPTSREDRWHYQEPIASKIFGFRYQNVGNGSTFSLDAPQGYRVENIAKPTVTEDEVIAYLKAAAGFNGGVFPDSIVDAYDVDKLNAESKLPEAESSKKYVSLRESRDRFLTREIYRAPVLQFIDDHAVPDTFQYTGAEVNVGEAEKIVAWYRPKNSTNYRVWFGDLTVKEMEFEKIPILKEFSH